MAIVLQVQVQVALQVPALVDTVVVDSQVVLLQTEVRLAMLQVEVMVDKDQMDTLVDTVVVVSLVVLHQAEVRLATLRVEVMVDKDLVLDLLVARWDMLLVAAKAVMAMEAKDQLDLQEILEVMEVDGLKGAQALMVMDLLVVVELPVVMVEDSPKRLQLQNMWIDRCQQNRS